MERYDLVHPKEGEAVCDVCGVFKPVEGTNVCPRHGANNVIKQQNKQKIYEINSERLRGRINVLASNPKRYTLDEELGVTRLTLEQLLNTIKEDEIYLHTDSISSLVSQIQKLVDSSIKVSKQLKLLMTPEDMNKVVQTLVDVLDRMIEDKEVLDAIATELLTTLDDVYSGRQSIGQMHDDPS